MSNLIAQLENGTPSDKVITLKSVYKSGKTTVQPTKDGYGWYRGIPRLSDEEKRKLKFWAEPDTKFVIQDGTTFDLSIEEHRTTWEWVKHCPCIAESEEACQFTKGAEFYPYIEEKAAEKSISKKLLRHKAETLILGDNSSNYPSRALLLGVNMNGDHPSVIQDYLLTMAEQSPAKVIGIYESHDISVRLLLLKAQDKGVIVIDNGLYRYGTISLGMTEESCVAWLLDNDNKNIVESIERDVNPEYFAKKEAASTVTESPAKSPVKKTTTKK